MKITRMFTFGGHSATFADSVSIAVAAGRRARARPLPLALARDDVAVGDEPLPYDICPLGRVGRAEGDEPARSQPTVVRLHPSPV
jgi:hypothetical protein